MSTNLSRAHDDLLIELYTKCPKTLDDMPYTGDFDQLSEQFMARSGKHVTHHDVWRALCRLRKASKLPRKER